MMKKIRLFCYFFFFFFSLSSLVGGILASNYTIGVGKADITGSPTQIGMMGYGEAGQIATGLRTRLYSRAFYFEHPQSKERFVYVSAEIQGMQQSITVEVINRLKKNLPQAKLSEKNVILSVTHNHSGPGAYSWHALYNLSTKGFDKENLEAIVSGITQSIKRAYENRKANSKVYIKSGRLFNSQFNRSPNAYQLNPKSEQEKYKEITDDGMTVLKIVGPDKKPVGMISWFALHASSVGKDNTLINSDNKGYASYLFEQKMGKNFIAAFGQANEGDISPNIERNCCQWEMKNGQMPICTDSLETKVYNFYGIKDSCLAEPNDCGKDPIKCTAMGPAKYYNKKGYDREVVSAKIMGQKQYSKALTLFNQARTEVSGSIFSVHKHIDMTRQNIQKEFMPCLGSYKKWCEKELHIFYDEARQLFYHSDKKKKKRYWPNKTCTAALGVGFAAGTTDGVGIGILGFSQSRKKKSFLGSMLSVFLSKNPTKTDDICHYPKPILLNLGKNSGAKTTVKSPFCLKTKAGCPSWVPVIIPLQIIRFGQVIIPSLPAEFTTMAGRRIKKIIQEQFPKDRFIMPFAGMSNVYSGYVTTFEEYQKQRYEAASTLYGPFTLAAYKQGFSALAKALKKEEKIKDTGPKPPNLTKLQISLLIPAKGKDLIGKVKNLGCFYKDSLLKEVYKPGEFLSYKYVGGNPRVNFLQMTREEKPYFTIERKIEGLWVKVKDDNDWGTTLEWSRKILGASHLTITWEIPTNQDEGLYRISYQGYATPWPASEKTAFYQKTSPVFEIRRNNKSAFKTFDRCLEKSKCCGKAKIRKGSSCKKNSDCEGYGFGTKKGTACCKGVCQEKKKDWAGGYWCPYQCKKSAFAKKGSC